MYHIAVILLEHGADKDFLSGWLGGSTATILTVIQSQRDLSAAQLVEVTALNAYSRAQTLVEQ